MPWWNPFAREVREDLVEAQAGPVNRAPARRQGYEFGIGQQGLNEYNQGTGTTGTDRRALMVQLYEAFLACPWAWSSVNAIARRVTAGELILEWDNQDGTGEEEPPAKPANVLAFEQLLAYCNARENIRQLIRGIVADLLVFGDAFVEVVWIGKQPVALHSLDSPSMFPVADEHGVITGYVQITESYQRADFEPREVIHISLDSPRSGVFGVSPTYAAMLPITSWLFTAATLKEIYRKGNPPNIHVDLPANADADVWLDQYMARNVGSRNIGRPIVTKNGGQVSELQRNGIPELLDVLSQRRDEIVSAYGVPPAQVGIIEAGNIGGGTGESQQKTFDTITCDPISSLILEALFFHLGKVGFGIEGWKLAFAEVDLRDSDTVEGIREKRLQNGVWTVNRWRADIGEPSVEGGDDAVLMGAATSNLVRITDLDASAKAGIAKQVVGTELSIGDPGDTGSPVELVKAPKPEVPPPGGPGGGQFGGGGPTPDGPPTPPPGPRPGVDTRDTEDDPEDDETEETAGGLELAEDLVDALAADAVAAFVDEHDALWVWSASAGTYERALDPDVAESLAAAGAPVYLDEHDRLWSWSVEETRYVRTPEGSAKYGLPIGAPIVPGAGKPKGTGSGKIAIPAKQKKQKATAAHFFGGGANGATWDADKATLTVTDSNAAVAHLDAGLASYSDATPVPKVAITAMKKKVAKLGDGAGGGQDGQDGQDDDEPTGPSAAPAAPAPAAPIDTQPGTLEEFQAIPDVDVNEPPLPDPGPGKRISTGIVVREPDGRVWILEPKGHFGGYEHTFPKGGLEDGLTAQQNAHKELFEEIGLTAKITGYVGDYQGSTGVTRMYVAERTGGAPHPDDPTPYVPGGLEAAAVKAVTPAEAAAMLNTKRDKKILADALAVNATSPAPDAAATPAGLVSTSGWTKTGQQKGSNPGGTYTAPNGTKYYVKQSKSDKHARNEVLAAELYKLAGIDHSDLQLADVGGGKLGTASTLVDGAKPNLGEKLADPQYKAAAQRGFAVDAWLANWDVAGATLDNIVTDASGKPVRIDPGGSLLFRAQGTPKGSAFTDTVGEWDTLRNGMNPQAKKVFGGMTPTAMKSSAQRVVDVTPADIDAAIAKAGFTGKDAKLLSERLKARRADVAKRAWLALPEGQQGAAAPTPDPTPATPATPAPKPADAPAAPALADEPVAVGGYLAASEKLGLDPDLGPGIIGNLIDDADSSGYPMALSALPGGGVDQHDDLPDIPDGTEKVLVATPNGGLTFYPTWKGSGSSSSTSSPSPAATPAPAPSAAPAAAGMIAFQSKQKSQKKVATTYFGPGTSGTGATFDPGTAKLTVTDAGAAVATLDKALAGPLGPGQKLSINNVKAKLVAIDSANPSSGGSNTSTPVAVPTAPSPTPTPAPGPVGTAALADGVTVKAMGVMLHVGSSSQMNTAKTMAKNSGQPVFLVKSGTNIKVPFLVTDLGMVPKGDFVKVDPDGTMKAYPASAAGQFTSAAPSTPAAPAAKAPAKKAAGTPVTDQKGAELIGVSGIEVGQFVDEVKQIGGGYLYTVDSPAAFGQTEKVAKKVSIAQKGVIPAGAPYLEAGADGKLTYHAKLPQGDPAAGEKVSSKKAAELANAAGIPVSSTSVNDWAQTYGLQGGGYLYPSKATKGYSVDTLYGGSPPSGGAFLKVDDMGKVTFHASADAPALPGPPMSAASKAVMTNMASKIGVAPIDLAQVRADALGNKSLYVTKGPDGKAAFHTSSADAKATSKPYVQVDKNGNFSWHDAGSGNSSTQPKGTHTGTGTSSWGTAGGSVGPSQFADHVPLPAATPYLGKPDGETDKQRAARLKVEHAAAEKYEQEYRKALLEGPGLTTAERDALKNYGGSGYGQINGGLRKPPPTAAAKAKIKRLNALMLKVPTPAPRTVWRGTGQWSPPTGLKAGDTFEDPGFVSTSLASDRAFGGTKLEISLPAGFPSVSVNGALTKAGAPHYTELELLLPHGTQFAVLSDEIKDGQRWMKVEAIPPAHMLEAMAK